MKRLVTFCYVLAVLLVLGGVYLTKNNPGSMASASSLAASADETGTKKIPGKLVFDNTESDPKYTEFAGYVDDHGKAPFDHKQHVDYKGSTCVTCHHTNSKTLVDKSGEASEPVMKCTVCHKDQQGKKTPSPIEGTNEDNKFKGKDTPEAQIAFHGDEKSTNKAGAAGCITCHKQLSKDFPKAAKVISCSSCHTGKDA